MLWCIARGLSLENLLLQSLNQNRGYILRNQETRRIKELLQQTMLHSKFSNLFNFVCNRIETYRSFEPLMRVAIIFCNLAIC